MTDRPLQDGQRLRDRGKLGGTHRRALVPLFRLELALRCQVLQVRAVVVQHRISARHVGLCGRDRLGRLRPLLVLRVQIFLRRLEERGLGLHRALEVGLRLRLGGLELDLLVAEGLCF